MLCKTVPGTGHQCHAYFSGVRGPSLEIDIQPEWVGVR